MSHLTDTMLDKILITREERKALNALLYSGLTGGALAKMGLERLASSLAESFNGPFEYEEGKAKVTTLETYGVTNCGQNIEVHYN